MSISCTDMCSTGDSGETNSTLLLSPACLSQTFLQNGSFQLNLVLNHSFLKNNHAKPTCGKAHVTVQACSVAGWFLCKFETDEPLASQEDQSQAQTVNISLEMNSLYFLYNATSFHFNVNISLNSTNKNGEQMNITNINTEGDNEYSIIQREQLGKSTLNISCRETAPACYCITVSFNLKASFQNTVYVWKIIWLICIPVVILTVLSIFTYKVLQKEQCFSRMSCKKRHPSQSIAYSPIYVNTLPRLSDKTNRRHGSQSECNTTHYNKVLPEVSETSMPRESESFKSRRLSRIEEQENDCFHMTGEMSDSVFQEETEPYYKTIN
ncbi:uncharacterized protein LOC122794496 [Protopterus annectens]|uniref:uncharacterized protein LOC122794496 n=1 Tax=Protopterus annectens TaxID=7888 RepID=UPI001CFAAECB|nr:uncharacterized protein LOC122794496 [Protopterus annectens]